MNSATARVAPVPSCPDHARFGSDRSVLRTIRDDAVTLAVWNRPVPERIAAGIVGPELARFRIPRFSAPPEIVTYELGRLLARQGLPIEAFWPIALDVGELAGLYASIMGLALVEVRLDHVPGDGCRKFHADYVTARLLTTYAGPATQWLDQQTVASLPGDALPHEDDIRQLAPGDVALLKGREASEDRPLVHRSPPMGEGGPGRLLLVLNPGLVTG